MNSDAKEIRVRFPAAGVLIKNCAEDLKKILIEGKSRVRYSRCNVLGALSPIGKVSPAGTCRWKCGARVGEPGCKMTCVQVVVFASALSARSPRSWVSIAQRKLTKRIDLLVVGSSQERVREPRVAKQRGEKPKVSAEKAGTNSKGLLDVIEVKIRKEINTEKGEKLLTLLMGFVRATLAPTNTPEGLGLVAVSERPKTTEVAPKPAAKPQSYAKAAVKNMRSWTKPTIKELEAPMRKEDKETLGLRTLQWKPLKPINKRLINPGQPLKEGTLKNKVKTTKFVYVGGMAR